MPTSTASLLFQRRFDGMLQRIINGAIRRSPVVSPSHHVIQIPPKLAQSANPPSARLVTPKAGPITVLTTAASANLTTPCGRSKTLVPLANRFTSQAPHTASSVLPLAMASDVATLPDRKSTRL